MLKQLVGVIQMLTKEKVLEWMDLYQKAIAENKDILSDYDDQIGDGDHGNNMNRGMTGVSEAILTKEPVDLVDSFKSISMALLSKVGGASGPLYGTAFIEMSKLAKTDTDLANLIQAGAKGIAKRGGAQVGDKTMLDVWEPVVESIKNKTLTSEKIDEIVETTKNMRAKKGRASYLGERSVGVIDPGAASSGLLFKALLKANII